MGSPDFAVPSLETLASQGHELSLVVSQPAKPVGRKAELQDPAVAARAKALRLPVFQPATLKDSGAVARLAGAHADVFVVVAYGKILPPAVLELPRLCCVNVHGSILPRWRGASPVQAALLAGDEETGASIMKMEEGMDSGPVFAVRRTRVEKGETAGALSERLAKLGASLLVETLPGIERGTIEAVPQPADGVTSCPKIRREDGRVDFRCSAIELERRARAFTPWPGLFAFRAGHRVKLSGVGALDLPLRTVPPGSIVSLDEAVVFACGKGALSVATLQAEGRRALDAPDFVRGERLEIGEVWE